LPRQLPAARSTPEHGLGDGSAGLSLIAHECALIVSRDIRYSFNPAVDIETDEER
jgi:hypothetical protein